ncbi:MAG: hypothetical protein CL678_03685 [Bdellovibrionaceae bacterium]|nr:hypothetical protein [Pseudobdellovibrionaceae bacterium]|tara:strand:- start:3654 stop:4268 length:615 start_codon:yes stop_codon:yes gene_type:complete
MLKVFKFFTVGLIFTIGLPSLAEPLDEKLVDHKQGLKLWIKNPEKNQALAVFRQKGEITSKSVRLHSPPVEKSEGLFSKRTTFCSVERNNGTSLKGDIAVIEEIKLVRSNDGHSKIELFLSNSNLIKVTCRGWGSVKTEDLTIRDLQDAFHSALTVLVPQDDAHSQDPSVISTSSVKEVSQSYCHDNGLCGTYDEKGNFSTDAR